MPKPEDSGFFQYPASTDGSREAAPAPAVQAETVSLLDLLIVLTKNLRMILLVTILAAAGAIAFSLYTLKMPADSPYNPMPNFYRPKVSVLLQDTQAGSMAASLTGELGLLAGLAGVASGGSTSANLAMWLLKENTILDHVINDYGFMDQFRSSKFPRSSARAALLEKTIAEFDETTGILTISYEDTDAEFAAEIVNALLSRLETRFRELTTDKANSKRVFLEERLAAAETDLKNAQNAIIEFQTRYGIIDLPSQAEASLKREADLRSNILSKELEIQNQLQYLRETDAQIVRLRNEIKVSKQLLNELETGFRQYSAASSFTQNQIPEISARFINLKRDLTVQETIYTTLRQQYETTKIDEADTSKRFQVVERAEVPELKAGPSRGLLCVIVTMSFFMLAVMAAFIREYTSRLKSDPEEAQKLEYLRSMVKRKKR